MSRILLGIGIALSIASVVSIYVTSVATQNQSLSSGQQLTSPSSSSSSQGSSQRTTTTTATTPQESGNLTQTISSLTPPTNRTFYLENTEISKINQTKLGIPPDVFDLTQLTAKNGDTVIINFYNLEDLVGGDNHSFTLLDGSYNIDKVLAPQQNETITFKADQVGVFQYFCKYHAPSMTGQLIVLP
ncbi:MAG TPA: cupredoxin domain-containing protein [Nitrososphaeraceae archaeon]|nr:cupredoxin domain-containing protein [Nitrososphaeraceae archaeon]